MVLLVLLAFWLPGLAMGAALGLRGWTLLAAAPALTFGIVSLGVVVLGHSGMRWTPLSVAIWTVALVLVVALLTRLLRRRSMGAPHGTASLRTAWRREAVLSHLGVGAGVAVGLTVGLVTFFRGIGSLTVINQDWDAPFHANAIRWIADHGDPLPSALAPIANDAGDASYFYPNTYHALLALLLDHAGLAMPQLLNFAAMMSVVVWPIGVAAVALAWRLSPLAAGVAAAVSTWFGTFPYDSLWRGPLWPYVAGLALVPATLAVVREIVDPKPRAPLAGPVGAVLAITGLIGLHTSLAFVLFVYLGMLVLALALRLEPVSWRKAAKPLVFSLVLAVAVVVPVVLPAMTSAGGVLSAQWPQLANPAEAFTQAVMFSSPDPFLQWYLGIPAVIGLALLVSRNRLTWMVGAYIFFALMYIAGAAYILPPFRALTGVFYTDVWRIAALLPLVGALGIGEFGSRVVRAGALRAGSLSSTPWLRPAAAITVFVVFAAALLVLTSGAYIGRNASRLAQNHGDGPTVSTAERDAYAWLGQRVRPNERVVNDVQDGAVWMYGLDGVMPVNWTFYGARPGSDAQFLLDNLNQLDQSPRVRETLARLNVKYAIFGQGMVRPGETRSPGMVNLSSVAGLQPVYQNSGATIYEILPAAVPARP
ncbi:hypothetical protein LWC33_02640 [Pseudonocardia sp. RS11V-5]|uniref:DUF6541 family protein n=1 Tax=Pseudonocardia terrae TaxID=2905831 RepID=UPI001E4842A9|nr:DUF6541 family protein [Pseudonocardia terrae]MCE3550356.1 hypothetical protein [Pseudonocardia terrae]